MCPSRLSHIPIRMAGIARQLAGRLALVTGSSSGIGYGIAEALAAQGSDVVIHGVETEPALEKIAAEIADKFDVKCYVSDCDLLDGEEAIVGMFGKAAADAHRPVDVVVNNAGIQVRQLLNEHGVVMIGCQSGTILFFAWPRCGS